MADDPIADSIASDAIAGIKSSTTDGTTTEALSMADRIAAAQFIAARDAASSGRPPIGLNRLAPSPAFPGRCGRSFDHGGCG